jgi:hypothetical protein
MLGAVGGRRLRAWIWQDGIATGDAGLHASAQASIKAMPVLNLTEDF